MSEIINMSNKVRALVDQLTVKASIGECVMMEMLVTFAYTEGFKDGYAKGYAESINEPPKEGE